MSSKLLSIVDFINTWADGISLVIFLASVKFGYDSVKKVMNKNISSKLSNDREISKFNTKIKQNEKIGDLEQIQKYIKYLDEKCSEYDNIYENLKLNAQQILVMCIEKFYYAESLVGYRLKELKSCQKAINEQHAKITNLHKALKNYKKIDLIEDVSFLTIEKMLNLHLKYLSNARLDINITIPNLGQAKERVKQLNNKICSLNNGI